MKARGGGRGRQSGKPSSRPAKAPEQPAEDKGGKPSRSQLACRDRFLEALLQLVGQQVSVDMKDGSTVDGLFHCVSGTHEFPFNFVVKASTMKTGVCSQSLASRDWHRPMTFLCG